MNILHDLSEIAQGILADIHATPWPHLLHWLATLALSMAIPLGLWLLLLLALTVKPYHYLLTPVLLFLYSPVAVIALLMALNVLVPRAAPAPAPGTLRLAHLNAYILENTIAPKLAFIQNSNAQVVSLIEVNPALAAALPSLKKLYPYQALTPQKVDGTYRILPTALLSQYPLKHLQSWSDDFHLYQLTTPKGPLYILQGHPAAPFTLKRYARRNQVLAEVAARSLPQPLIAVGDFNTTPWDPALAPLKKQLTLAGSWLPTWPAYAPVTPIDLLWSTANLPLTHLHRVNVAATDHLGLIADFHQ